MLTENIILVFNLSERLLSYLASALLIVCFGYRLSSSYLHGLFSLEIGEDKCELIMAVRLSSCQQISSKTVAGLVMRFSVVDTPLTELVPSVFFENLI